MEWSIYTWTMSPHSFINRGQTAPWSNPIIAGAFAVRFTFVLEREMTAVSFFSLDGVTTYKLEKDNVKLRHKITPLKHFSLSKKKKREFCI